MRLKKNFTLICFYIIVLLLISSGGCSKGSHDAQNNEEPTKPAVTPVLKPIKGFFVYENSTYNIRIQYPENWNKMEGEYGAAFIIPKEDENAVFEGFNILFEKMYGVDMSLEEYMKITDEGMKKYMSGFKLIESAETTLDGHPAYQLIYHGVHESVAMKFFSMFTIRKGNVYSLSFNTLPENYHFYEETLKKIIDSFQFLS